MAKRFYIKMTLDDARTMARRLSREVSVEGADSYVDDDSLSLVIHKPKMKNAPSEAPDDWAVLVAEHADYLICRPIVVINDDVLANATGTLVGIEGKAFSVGVNVEDASKDFPVKKPFHARKSSFHNQYLIRTDGEVSLAVSTGNSARTLTNVDDDSDTTDQVIVPPYRTTQQKTIDGSPTWILGDKIRIKRGVPGDIVGRTNSNDGNRDDLPIALEEAPGSNGPRAWGKKYT